MQPRTLGILLSATALSILGIASPSAADEPRSLTATTPAPRSLPGESHHDVAVRAALEHLSKTQTREEIQAVLESGEPTESLADPVTLEVIAARLAEPAPRLFEIVPRGPGCAATDACATGAASYGYYGTGGLTVNLPGITKVFSGNEVTTWWMGTEGLIQPPNSTRQYGAPGVRVTRITRGGPLDHD